MICLKKLTSKQVLEEICKIAMEELPEDVSGNLNLSYDDEGGIEIYFVSDEEIISERSSNPN